MIAWTFRSVAIYVQKLWVAARNTVLYFITYIVHFTRQSHSFLPIRTVFSEALPHLLHDRLLPSTAHQKAVSVSKVSIHDISRHESHRLTHLPDENVIPPLHDAHPILPGQGSVIC